MFIEGFNSPRDMRRKTVANLLVLNLIILSISLMSYHNGPELEEHIVLSTPDQGELVSLSWAPEHGDCVSRKNMLVINSMYSDFEDPNYNAPRYSNTQIVDMLNILDEYFYNVSYHNICFHWHLFGMDESGDGLIDSPVPIGLRSTISGYSGLVNNAVNSLVGFEDHPGLITSTNVCNDPQNGYAYDRGLLIVSSRNELGSFNYAIKSTALTNIPLSLQKIDVANCAPRFAVVSDGKMGDDCLINSCSVANIWTPRVWGTWAHELYHAVGGDHQSWGYKVNHDIMGTAGVASVEPNLFSRTSMGWFNPDELTVLTPADIAGTGGNQDSSGKYGLRPLQMYWEPHTSTYEPSELVTYDPNQPCYGGDGSYQGSDVDDCTQGIVIPMSDDGTVYYLVEGRPAIGFDSYRMADAANVPGTNSRPSSEAHIHEGVIIYRVNLAMTDTATGSSYLEPVRTIDAVLETTTLNDASFIPDDPARKYFAVEEGGLSLEITVSSRHNDYYIVDINYQRLLGGGTPMDVTIPTNIDCTDYPVGSHYGQLGFTGTTFLFPGEYQDIPFCTIGHTASPAPALSEPIDSDVQWKIWIDCNLNNDIDENGKWLGEGTLSWDLPQYVYSSNGVNTPSSGNIPSYMGDHLCPSPAENRIYVEVTNNGLGAIGQQQIQATIGFHKLTIGSLPQAWVGIGKGACPDNFGDSGDRCKDDPAHYSTGEQFTDAGDLNGIYDIGEQFTDADGNDIWTPPEWRLLPGDSVIMWYEWKPEPGSLSIYNEKTTESYLVGIHSEVLALNNEENVLNNHWMVPSNVISMTTSSPYNEQVHHFDVISPFNSSVDVELSVEGIPETWEWNLEWDVMNGLTPGTVYENTLYFKAPDSWPVGVYTDFELNGTFMVTIENDSHAIDMLNQRLTAHSELATEVEAQISDLEIEEVGEFTISGTMDVPKSGHSGIELNGQDVLFLYESPSGEQFAERTPIRNGEVEDSFNPSVVTNDSVGIWTAYIIYLGDSNHSYSQAEIQFEVTPSDDRDTGEITPGFSIWTFIISLIFALAVVQRNRFSDLENGNTLGDNTD